MWTIRDTLVEERYYTGLVHNYNDYDIRSLVISRDQFFFKFEINHHEQIPDNIIMHIIHTV